MNKQLFRPLEISEKLIRLGEVHDGGYIINEGSLNCDCLFTYGIGTSCLFEEEWETKTGKPSFLYDMTVDSPTLLPKMKFFKEGLSGTKQRNTDNFLNHYAKEGITSKNVLLKIDVEGAEYEWLQNTDIKKLADIVSCLIVEFHSVFSEPFEEQINILKKFYNIIHVHGNNNGSVRNEIPEVPEITFLRKDSSIFLQETKEKYPKKDIDSINNIEKIDMTIDFSTTT